MERRGDYGELRVWRRRIGRSFALTLKGAFPLLLFWAVGCFTVDGHRNALLTFRCIFFSLSLLRAQDWIPYCVRLMCEDHFRTACSPPLTFIGAISPQPSLSVCDGNRNVCNVHAKQLANLFGFPILRHHCGDRCTIFGSTLLLHRAMELHGNASSLPSHEATVKHSRHARI